MIVVYAYPEKVIRYTEVAVIREQLDRKHSLRLRNGRWVTPKTGWISHEVKLSKGEEAEFGKRKKGEVL